MYYEAGIITYIQIENSVDVFFTANSNLKTLTYNIPLVTTREIPE